MNKKELLQNIVIGLVLFGLIFIVYFVTEDLKIFFVALAFWLLYMIFMGYTLFLKKQPNEGDNYAIRMKKANKYKKFNEPCILLLDGLQVLEFRREFFEKYQDGSIKKSFELLEKHILHNVEIAVTFMENYNYHAIQDGQSMERLHKAVLNCSEATKKLRELYDATVKVDDSATSIDISYVDNLLESLNDITTEENI